jgi:hypothetical protein
MPYPTEILPQDGHRLIVCNLLPFNLTRYTNTKDIFDEAGLISLTSIVSPKEGIMDLSLSLLGIFKYNHNLITLTDDGKADYNHMCAPDLTVNVPEETIHYTINNERSWWTISIQQLMEQEYDCIYKEKEIKFIPIITHTPMMWNFWHFSLTWEISNFDIETIESATQKKKFKDAMASSARSAIQQYAKSGEIAFTIIDANDYK